MNRTKIYQTVTQFIFLALFVILILTGKIQLWMGVFIISAVAALLFSRFYCGWLCPINTVMKLTTKLKKRLGKESMAVPKTLKKPVFRYGMLGILMLILVLMMSSGKKLPILPLLFAVGVSLTVFFPENLWHRYLCPYGTILNFFGAKAKKYPEINQSVCIECGICGKVCPGGAIIKTDRYFINKGLCLICLECAYQCPKEAIHYN